MFAQLHGVIGGDFPLAPQNHGAERKRNLFYLTGMRFCHQVALMKKLLPYLVIVPLVLTSCNKESESRSEASSGPDASGVAKPGDAGASFHGALDNIVANLETDGSHFSITHIDEDLKQLAETLDGLLEIAKETTGEVPPNLNVVELFDELGLSRIDAMGRSSRWDEDAWHNRLFVQTHGNRSGLLSVMGDEGSEWRAGKSAPADADLVIEFELNLRRVMQTMKTVSASFGEEVRQGFAEAMKEKIAGGAMTMADLFGKTDLRATLIVSLDREQRWLVSEGVELPGMHGAMRIERGMWLWARFGEQIEQGGEVSERDGLKIVKAPEQMDTPMGKIRPVIVLDAAKDLIWVSLTEDYLAKCESSDDTLASRDDFKRATKGFPEKGNGLFYVSADFCEELRRQVNQVRENVPDGSETSAAFDVIIGLLGFSAEDTTVPNGYAWCVSNTKTGILCVGNSPFPDKGYGMMSRIGPIAALSGMATPLILKQKKRADQFELTANMKPLHLALLEYNMEMGQFPDQLSDLVDAKFITQETLSQLNRCQIDGETRELVYIPGLSVAENPATILMHTPAPIDGKRVYLKIDGSVHKVPENEFLELIKKQQARE